MAPEKEDDLDSPSGARSPEEASRVRRLSFNQPRVRRLFPESSPAPESHPVRVSTPSFNSSEEQKEDNSGEGSRSIADRTAQQFAASVEAPATTQPQAALGPRLLFGGNTHQAFPITEDDILGINPHAAQNDLLRLAIGIALSFSVSDPASRFAVFASDLQADYGLLLEESLELGVDPHVLAARESFQRLLAAVEEMDFAAVLKPQGWFASIFLDAKKPEAVRDTFTRTLERVKNEQSGLKNGLSTLDEVRSRMLAHEERRKALLLTLQAHVLAGRVIHGHLTDDRKDTLFARLLSLEITAATAESEQHGELLVMSLDGLVASIRDTLLTWVPVWLSTANQALVLLENQQLQTETDAYRRLLEARMNILTLKKE